MPSSITTLTAITRPASRGPNTPPPPEKGVLDGRYVLGDEIGSGGFAAVFRAFDRHLGIDVAIKVLKEHGVRDEEFRARFLREMTHHVLLRHPRIVPVLDRGVTPHGRLYFVMELLEGRSLSEHLRAQPGPRPWEEVVVVVKQLCEALETVHTRQIVHRDVKPGNVFVCGSGEDLAIRLLDLGIAKELPGAGISAPEEPSLTDVRVGVPGTPEYMAPEQIEGRPVDGRTDLYAVGVLMYRMLTGVLPFQPPDPLESEARHSWLARQHCEARPLRPSRRCPEAKIPAALEALVMSLLAKRASSRPQSARELRSALRQIERSLAHSAAEFAAWRRYVWRSLWWSTVALSCALFMLLDVPGGGQDPGVAGRDGAPSGDGAADAAVDAAADACGDEAGDARARGDTDGGASRGGDGGSARCRGTTGSAGVGAAVVAAIDDEGASEGAGEGAGCAAAARDDAGGQAAAGRRDRAAAGGDRAAMRWGRDGVAAL